MPRKKSKEGRDEMSGQGLKFAKGKGRKSPDEDTKNEEQAHRWLRGKSSHQRNNEGKVPERGIGLVCSMFKIYLFI